MEPLRDPPGRGHRHRSRERRSGYLRRLARRERAGRLPAGRLAARAYFSGSAGGEPGTGSCRCSRIAGDPIARIIARFADGFVAVLSCVASIAAASSAPDKSVCDLLAGPLFGTFMWVSGFGFLIAAVLALACRKSTGAKIACAGGLVLAAGLGTIFLGLSEMNIHEGQGRTRQDTLRLVVEASGGHAYWLGSKFHGAQPSWEQDSHPTLERELLLRGRHQHGGHGGGPDANPSADYGEALAPERVVPAAPSSHGQRSDRRGCASREARANLEPIPPNVTVSGSTSRLHGRPAEQAPTVGAAEELTRKARSGGPFVVLRGRS